LSTTSNIVETQVNAFQRRLDNRRLELGLTISALARRADLPYSTARRIVYERLAQPPKQEQLEAFAKAVGWEPEWVIRDAHQAWFPDLSLHADEDEDIQILVATAKQLTKRDLRALIRAAQAYRHENGE
jgi:transcriptional regulator with XRE-family HTH domain